MHLDAELDIADALDLETAVAAGAGHRAAIGSTEPLDVRRAQAVGDLARRQLALDLDSDASQETRPRVKPRQVVIHVHLSAAALTGPHADGTLIWSAAMSWPPSSRSAAGAATPRPRSPSSRSSTSTSAPRSPRTTCPSGSPSTSRSATRPASSPGAPDPPVPAIPINPTTTRATVTTSIPAAVADRPARATWRPCAGGIIGSRPTPRGPTSSSTPASPAGCSGMPARPHQAHGSAMRADI